MRDNTNAKIHAGLLAGFVKLTQNAGFIGCRRGDSYDFDILAICA